MYPAHTFSLLASARGRAVFRGACAQGAPAPERVRRGRPVIFSRVLVSVFCGAVLGIAVALALALATGLIVDVRRRVLRPGCPPGLLRGAPSDVDVSGEVAR